MKTIYMITGKIGAGKTTIKDYLSVRYNLSVFDNKSKKLNKDSLGEFDLFILDPTNLIRLKDFIYKQHLDLKVIILYIKTEKSIRKERLINSPKYESKLEGENEFFTHEINDELIYNEFEEKSLYDYCIDNSETISGTILQVDEIIQQFL